MNFSDSEESDDELILKSAPAKPVETRPPVTGMKHLHDIKDMLGLDSYQNKLEKKRRKREAAKARKAGKSLLAVGAVSTEASRKLGLTSPPEVVTFVDHKKRSKPSRGSPSVLSEQQNTRKPGKELSMKDARFEVFKFGVSGLDQKSREEANTALAVRLGAKPARNKGVDYKQLKEDRVKEKEEKLIKEEEHRNSLQGVRKSSKNGMTSKKSANKAKKKKGKKGEFKVGAFDGGMLKLSQKDISSIKSKKKS